jgi:hypothetical protein
MLCFKQAHQVNPYAAILKTLTMLSIIFNSAFALAEINRQLEGMKNFASNFEQNLRPNLYNTKKTSDKHFILINLGLIHAVLFFRVEGNPVNIRANVNFNILGNVASNPIESFL